MDKLVYLIGPAGCAVVMVVCMAMMGRGMRRQGTQDDPTPTEEVAALRAEVAELRSERQTAVDG